MIGFKRFQQWMVIAAVFLLVGAGVPTYAQTGKSAARQGSGDPIPTESISFNFADMSFSPTSTSSRTISNVRVAAGDVNGDSVEISFDLTVTGRDGTSNTLSIIAILIGLVRERGQSTYLNYRLEDVIISSVVAGNMIGTDARAQAVANAAARNVTSAFNRYVRSLVIGIDQPFRMEQTADGILIGMLLPE